MSSALLAQSLLPDEATAFDELAVRTQRALVEARTTVRPLWASGLLGSTGARHTRRATVRRAQSRLTPVALSPPAPRWGPTKERGAAFGLSRDGLGVFTGLLDGRERDAGKCFQTERGRTGCERQRPELRLLSFLEDPGVILKCLDLGV
jgi:hypothetical protein